MEVAREHESGERPTLAHTARVVREGIAKRDLVVVVGSCRVIYDGRASSVLQKGDRLLLIKEDGSIQVHRPTGHEPVNWQPAGCIVQADLTKEMELKIRAHRLQPRETVEVLFDDVYSVLSVALVDSGEFTLHVSEEEMQRVLIQNPSLIEQGFRPTAHERELETGFIDIYGEDGSGNLMVVEIKRAAAGNEAVLQLERYISALRNRINRPIRGIIAAPELKRDAMPLLSRLGFEFKQISLKTCHELLNKPKNGKMSDYVNDPT